MRKERRQSQPIRQPSANSDSYAFRRSRTITGSAATNVRAAGEERGQLQSSRLHEHSLRKHRRRLSTYLLLSIVAVGGLWYVVSSYIGSSISVGTQGLQSATRDLEESRYQALVNKYFSEHPFERFSFSLKEDAFSQFVRSHAPEVKDAQLVKTNGFGSAALALKLREPVVAWTIKNEQYYVDAEGESFTVNYFATPAVVVNDKSGINSNAGAVASTKLLYFIGRVITLVNESLADAPVASVELPANSTREIDFKLTGREYIVKADLDRDPAGQAADIVNAVNYVKAKNINPAYLDVRVEAKAYYRDR